MMGAAGADGRGDLAVAAYDEDLRAVERRFDYGNLCVVVLRECPRRWRYHFSGT